MEDAGYQQINLPDIFSSELLNFLRRFSRLAALGTLSSVVIHDIRNSIAIMSGNAQLMLMQQDGTPPDEIKKRLEQILTQIDKIMMEIEHVGSFSGRATGLTALFSTTTSLDNALKAHHRALMEKNIKVERNDAAPWNMLEGDATLLEYGLMEVLGIIEENVIGSGILTIESLQVEGGWRTELTVGSECVDVNQIENVLDIEKTFTLAPAVIALSEFGAVLSYNNSGSHCSFRLDVPVN